MPLTHEQQLAEAEELIRTAPDRATAHHETDENLEWCARVQTLAAQYSLEAQIETGGLVRSLFSRAAIVRGNSFPQILILLRRIRHSLRLELGGPVNLALDAGAVFHYFEALRNIIAEARDDLFFIDPYIDAEFVARYLEPLEHRPTIRLLTRERLKSVLPAAEALTAQSGINIQIRSVAGFHDRYVIVDRAACYQSGASFKDGAKTSPTTLTQVLDLFSQLLATYERTWVDAKVHFPAPD